MKEINKEEFDTSTKNKFSVFVENIEYYFEEED